MSQSEKLEIEITGKDTGGKAAVSDLRDEIAKLEAGLVGYREQMRQAVAANDPSAYSAASRAIREQREEISSLTQQLNGLTNGGNTAPAALGNDFRLLGGIVRALTGDSFPELERTLNEIGTTGTEAANVLRGLGGAGAEGGAGAAAGLTPVALALGGIAVALATVIGLAAKFAADSVNTRRDWEGTVAAVQQVTGAGAELSSVFATVGDLATGNREKTTALFAALTDGITQAEAQQAKLDETLQAGREKASEQITALKQKETERVGDLQQAQADKLVDLTQRQAQIEAQAAEQSEESARAHGEKLADIAKTITRTQADFARDGADQQREFDERRATDYEKTATRLSDIEAQRVKQAGEIQAELADVEQSGAEKRADIESNHVGTIADLQKQVVTATEETSQRREEIDRAHTERAGDLAQQLTETRKAALDKQVQDAADAAGKLKDVETRLNDQLAALTDRRAERERAAAEQLADLQDSFAERQESRQQRLADRLTSLDEQVSGQRQALQSRLLNARDEFEQTAIQAEIDALAATTDKKKQDLEAAATDEDTKAQAEFDKKTARIKERLDREAALQAEQAAKLKADAEARTAELVAVAQAEAAQLRAVTDARVADIEQRITRETEAYTRQTTALVSDSAARLADLQNRITKENAEYDKQTARLNETQAERVAKLRATLAEETAAAAQQTEDIKAEYAKRLDTETAVFIKQNEDARRAFNERIGDLQGRIDKEDAAYARSTEKAKKVLDEQTANNKAAQAKVLADTQDRIAKEEASYTESVSRINTAFETFASGIKAQSPALVGFLKDQNVEWATFAKLPIEAQQTIVLDKLGKMKEGLDQNKAAQDLLGGSWREGITAATIFAREGIGELTKYTDANNKSVGQGAIDAAKQRAIAMEDIRIQNEKFKQQAGEEIGPEVDKLNDKFAKLQQNSAVIALITNAIAQGSSGTLAGFNGILDLLNGDVTADSFRGIASSPLFAALFPQLSTYANINAAIAGPGQTANPGTTATPGGTTISPTINYYGTPAPTPGQVIRSLGSLQP